MNNNKLTPVHPGRILQNKFLIPLKITQSQLAHDIKVSVRKINEICQGKRGITVDTATRLAIYWPADYNFATWLRDTKQLTAEQVLNHSNEQELRQEYQTHQQTQIEQPPK